MQAFDRMYEPHEAREDTVVFPAFRQIVPAGELAGLAGALAVTAPLLGRQPEGGMSLAAWPGLVPGRSGRRGRTAVIGRHSKALGTVSDLGASRSARP